VSEQELQLPNYALKIREDRTDTTNGRGGGILVYVREGSIVAYEEKSPALDNLTQGTCLKLITKHRCIKLYVIYRSPNSPRDNDAALQQVIGLADKDSIYIGDFNYPDIDWKKMTCTSANSRGFLDTVMDNFLHQFVDFPTRKQNILDLLLARDPNLVDDTRCAGKLGKSDHDTIQFIIHQNPSGPPPSVERVPNFSKACFDDIKRELSRKNWELVLDGMTTEQAWLHVKNTISSLTSQYVPFAPRRTSSRPMWMSSSAIRAVRKKQRKWISYRSGHSSEESYKAEEKKAKKEVRKARRNFEKNLAKEVRKNPRKFYSYVNARNKRPGVGPLVDEVGNILSTDEAMANEFNRCFSTAFGKNGDIRKSPPIDLHRDNFLTTIQFSIDAVTAKLLELKPSSAPGPDKIYPRLLRECAHELAVPLQMIFTKSMCEGIVPAEWKSTNITPIYKKGRKNSAVNYRPINLASVPAKIMESIIKDEILKHLRTNDIIIGSQHGFLPGRSCTTNLVDYLNEVTKTLDKGASYDVILVDFQKAFDKVPFDGMLAKAKAHGINGELLKWLENWTISRKQRVVLNGAESDWADVLSSVVQGSVLGPILFLIYINDIDAALVENDNDIYISKFADDTKVGREVNNANDAAKLQICIDNLVQWCRDWGMSLHPDKCVVLHFGLKNPQIDYYIANSKIKTESIARDLGIYISNTGETSAHVEKITKKAHAMLSQIHRATIVRDRQTVMAMYKSFVRPLLESSAPAWNPSKRGDIDALERVQRRATRMINDKNWPSNPTYEERLQLLGIQSLESRRLRGDLIETYKYMNGFNDVNHSQLFSFVRDRHPVETRSHTNNHLVSEKTTLNVRKFFFTNRVTSSWNSLPNEVKEAPSVNSFKNLYDNHIGL